MFYTEGCKKHIFANSITLDKVDKTKETKTTPNVHVNISAYDKIVQLVTNNNTEIKPQQEQQRQVHMSV